MDPYDSLLDEPTILGGAFQSDAWEDAAVPGRVGGFMASGAWGRSGGGLVGGGLLGASEAAVDGLDVVSIFNMGGGGSGLFGGSDGLADPGCVRSSLKGVGLFGVLGDDDSFDMGDGGIASVSPFPSCPVPPTKPYSFRACSMPSSSFSMSWPSLIVDGGTSRSRQTVVIMNVV